MGFEIGGELIPLARLPVRYFPLLLDGREKKGSHYLKADNMKSDQLRRGNLIRLIPEGTAVTISGIDPNGGVFYNGNSVPIDEEDFEFIPLTEDWFANFGFEKSKHQRDSFSIRIDETIFMSLTIGLSGNGFYYLFHQLNFGDEVVSHDNKLFFVHQLQNLYHALTGKELE